MLPPHTKKPLGTGLVGLEEIHICPVQAIGIQSFTLSNATKREKRNGGACFAFQHPQERNSAFDWCLKQRDKQIPPRFNPVRHTVASDLGDQTALLPNSKSQTCAFWWLLVSHVTHHRAYVYGNFLSQL